MKNELDRKWINFIDSNVIDVYPIQFANCDRLQNNDAVYIFDEVGSGKTISSGLMALDYLVNNPEKEVYIVTTNALAKKGYGSEYGQFLRDWYEKLPFMALGLTNRIKVVNNHFSNICKLKKCGLIIIDEAQLFLNTDSLRYLYLSKISSEKVVFLTATPIKNSKNDLYTYVSLAKAITGKSDLDDKWIEDINTDGKKTENIICSSFDVEYPVTRYFKDTIMSINVKGYEKKQARRLIPQLWEYGKNNVSKKDVLLNKINECLSKTPESRFVVFTRFVEKEAVAIGKFLEENDFYPYDNSDIRDHKTYKIVTGDNGYELSNFSGTNNLPTVLILTYQIAEQGVNLPGYNYVINYHISSFPSALEQRFGRIDRMGKKGSAFLEINMCFLISGTYWDTDTWNFYSAVSIYLKNLISYLPSKNTVLSEEIISKYIEKREYVEEYVKKIMELIDSEQQIELIIEYFEKVSSNELNDQNTVFECDKDLLDFIDENGIEMNLEIGREEAIKQFRNSVKNAIKEYKEIFDSNALFSSTKVIEIIRRLGDKVFYLSNGKINTIDAIEDCGKLIANTAPFIEYKTEFAEKVKLPLTVAKYKDRINSFFENKFIENDFSYIFPLEGYKKVFEKIFIDDNEISIEEKQLLIDNSEKIVLILPFFKMCKLYEKIIQNMESSIRWGKEGYDYNQFQSAFYQIYHKVRESDMFLGLSENFFMKYFNEKEEMVKWYDKNYDAHYSSNVYVNSSKYYQITKDGELLQATNWYKLAYHFTRKEAWYEDRERWYSGDNNIYYIKDRLIQYLLENYDDYRKTEKYEVKQDYEKIEECLKNVICQIKNQYKSHCSLFSFYYFTENGNIRKYSFDKPYIGNGKVKINDIWTQGIIYELYGIRFENCMIGNILPSTELLKEIHICY